MRYNDPMTAYLIVMAVMFLLSLYINISNERNSINNIALFINIGFLIWTAMLLFA